MKHTGKRALLAATVLLLASGGRADPPSLDIPIYAVSLVDKPYQLGGDLPADGLDCSGFVGHVFRQTTGLVLPRDSLAISQASVPIAQADLLPGDLVFFNTQARAFSHVGIYLGEARFVHATSSRTGRVMISNLNEAYWRERFDGARRVAPIGAVSTAE
jgi:cell wall-associated NlpC family hydrolase